MADINSGLPFRTQIPSQVNYDDVIVKIGDATNPATQQLAIDSTGRVTIKAQDGAGNALTSQASGGQRALDVGINVGGVQIDPRQIRALTTADIVTVAQGSAAATHGSPWWTRMTDGTNDAALAPASTAATALQAALVVALSPNSPLPTGSNVIGSVNQGTSPWITKDQADGSATGGTAGAFSLLAGGLFNSALPTLTNGQQAAIQLDASGRLIIRPLTATLDTVVSNQGTAGSAAQGWFSKITDGANTAAVKAASTAPTVSDPALVVTISPNCTPIPVTISVDAPGTEIDAYNTASAVAGGSSSNHDYTVTALKTLLLTQIEASASGKMKIEVQVETGVASGVFNTRFVQFNSTANPNCTLKIGPVLSVAAGVRVRVIRTNKDNSAQDVYSTIMGQEV